MPLLATNQKLKGINTPCKVVKDYLKHNNKTNNTKNMLKKDFLIFIENCLKYRLTLKEMAQRYNTILRINKTK